MSVSVLTVDCVSLFVCMRPPLQDFHRTVDGWSLEDLSLALSVLSQYRKSERGFRPSDPIAIPPYATPLTHVPTLTHARRMIEFSHACYLGSTDAFVARVRDVKWVTGDWRADAAALRPAFNVCECERSGDAVVSVRGSYSIDDVITIAVAVPEPFLNGYVHRGERCACVVCVLFVCC